VTLYVEHTLVTFGGVLNTSQSPTEIWQCGVRLVKRDTAPTQGVDDPDHYLADVRDGLVTWWQGGAAMPSRATLAWVKANNIGTDGLFIEPRTHVHDYSPSNPGTAGTIPLPDIMSLVVSWTTDAVRGRSARGRVFLPNYAIAEATSGGIRVESTVAAAWATKGHDLLTVLANTGGLEPMVPSICSGLDGSHRTITGVRVGDVLDVQRRRKSAAREVYQAVSF